MVMAAARTVPRPYGGGSYSDCADPTQPGVPAVVKYLQSLPHPVDPHCEVGHYYLLNNYNPGYFGHGENAFADESRINTVFTIPPSSTRSIGDDLIANDVSWKYYGDQWNDYAGIGNPNQPLCSPPNIDYELLHPRRQISAQLRSGRLDERSSALPLQRRRVLQHLQPVPVRHVHHEPSRCPHRAHPGHSEPLRGHRRRHASRRFLRQAQRIRGWPSIFLEARSVRRFRGEDRGLRCRPTRTLWKNTAIIITFDEGGGYYDSGYVQPLDFFGDGTRIPLIVVSKYSTGGHISHDYSDHVSILKFIERNWVWTRSPTAAGTISPTRSRKARIPTCR